MAWRTCLKIDALVHISQLRSSREKSVTSLTRSKYRCVCTRRDVAFWPEAVSREPRSYVSLQVLLLS